MSAPNGIPFFTFEEADLLYQKAAKELKCCKRSEREEEICNVDIQCLRQKTTREIQTAIFSLKNALTNGYLPRTGFTRKNENTILKYF